MRRLATFLLNFAVADVDDLNHGNLLARITGNGFGAKRIVQHASTMFAEVAGGKMSLKLKRSLGADQLPSWPFRPQASHVSSF